jgi:hypothetical protein
VSRQQSQTRLDDLAFGPQASCRHGLGEKRVIDLDVGSHALVHFFV